MEKRVVVTGLGAVTPLGNDARSSWEAAVAGRSGIDWIRSFDVGELVAGLERLLCSQLGSRSLL